MAHPRVIEAIVDYDTRLTLLDVEHSVDRINWAAGEAMEEAIRNIVGEYVGNSEVVKQIAQRIMDHIISEPENFVAKVWCSLEEEGYEPEPAPLDKISNPTSIARQMRVANFLQGEEVAIVRVVDLPSA